MAEQAATGRWRLAHLLDHLRPGTPPSLEQLAAAAQAAPVLERDRTVDKVVIEEARVHHDQPDVIIIGCGVVGSAIASVLGTDGRKVLVLERSLAEPDRIVGELLQPGGVKSLTELGLRHCLDGIDAEIITGYGVQYRNKKTGKAITVDLPYPDNEHGVQYRGAAFHHGRFIQKLREAASRAPNVELLQATVTKLIEGPDDSVLGVEFKRGGKVHRVMAPLTISCEGVFSKFRKNATTERPKARTSMIGIIMELENRDLLFPNHGFVALADPGPVLVYPIGTRSVRVLIDLPNPIPRAGNGDLKRFLLEKTVPQMPTELQAALTRAIEQGPLRTMPASVLFSKPQDGNNQRKGFLLLGDSWNMRSPLTGGGMSVGFADALYVRQLVREIPDLRAAGALDNLGNELARVRKPTAATINVLAGCIHAVFAANEDPSLPVMQEAIMKYFQLGGRWVAGPIGLLSCLISNPSVLVSHFFLVALYGMFMQVFPFPTPSSVYTCIKVITAAVKVVFPLLEGENVPIWSMGLL